MGSVESTSLTLHQATCGSSIRARRSGCAGLATVNDRGPAITLKGRKALVRGSFSLLDAAA